LLQVGEPGQVYKRPRSRFVADFSGDRVGQDRGRRAEWGSR
jgi:ABC-type Fe3+/spermidine/putrescine transport system ATPase subunit